MAFLRSILRVSAIAALVASLAVSPAMALDASQHSVRGQVFNVSWANVDGSTFGLALAVERGVETEPFTELLISRSAGEWLAIRLNGGANMIAVGDVDGDGSDDVAVSHQLRGDTCPLAAQGATGSMPCGVVRIYDGSPLVQGQLVQLAELTMSLVPDTCQPTTSTPSAIELEDVTGDGRAELAVTQLSSLQGSCGTVNVLPGNSLHGSVGLNSACVRIKGPVMRNQPHPDLFGSEIGLFGNRYLAIGAPYADHPAGSNVTGMFAVYDIRHSCATPPSTPVAPEPAFVRYGAGRGDMMGTDSVFVDGLLWVASKGKVESFSAPTFTQQSAFAFERTFPLAPAGDLDGDGRKELLVGPRAIDQEGKTILQMAIVSHETFRAAFVGPDHLVASDRFGTRLLSLTNIWDPHLSIYSEKALLMAGETTTVRVAEAVFLLPDAGPLRWHVAGATVLETNATWVRIKAGAPGMATVQATLEDAVATVRIPVDLPDRRVLISGPDAVLAGHPFAANVHAPEGSAVTWQAMGGTVSAGTGHAISTSFPKPGPHEITVRVRLADGSEGAASLKVSVLQEALKINAPTRVAQGEAMTLSVQERSGHSYTWTIAGARETATAQGASITLPAGGWGILNVTVVANDGASAVAVGHTPIFVNNLPPRIQTLNLHASSTFKGIEGSALAQDPGGDKVTLSWMVAGQPAGSGDSLTIPVQDSGNVEVQLVATDEAGLSTKVVRSIAVAAPWTARNVTQQVSSPPPLEGDESFIPGPGPLAILVLLFIARRRSVSSRPGREESDMRTALNSPAGGRPACPDEFVDTRQG